METKADDLEAAAQPKGKEPGTDSKDVTATSAESGSAPELVPDPEEDDLDDLDDMLDEFTSSNTAAKPAKAPSDPAKPPLNGGVSDEDFAAQLQAGMAELMGELDNNPDMASQFESMLKELGAGGVGKDSTEATPSSSKDSKAQAAKVEEESFQETIRKTMERMRASGDSATAAASSSEPEDLLAEMMKAMQSSGLDGEGSEEDFSKMILGMMEQLTNKDILYEPMKELNDKFPAWMEKNAATCGEADLKRYKEQQGYVREIVERFEKKEYSDEDPKDREFIVERMQKMQAAGSPPSDLVGDMAAAQEAFGAPEEGCPTQ